MTVFAAFSSFTPSSADGPLQLFTPGQRNNRCFQQLIHFTVVSASFRGPAGLFRSDEARRDVGWGLGLFILSQGFGFSRLLPSSLSAPGACASLSLPATKNYATPPQREVLRQVYKRFGCHTCGNVHTIATCSYSQLLLWSESCRWKLHASN